MPHIKKVTGYRVGSKIHRTKKAAEHHAGHKMHHHKKHHHRRHKYV